MLGIFQLRIRDLLWFMLVCALCALLARQQRHSLHLLDLRRETTWVVNEVDGSMSMSDLEYHAWIDDGTSYGHFVQIRNASGNLAKRLERLRTGPDSQQYIHMPPPPGQSPR
jgi:hypothetical protein